MPEIPPPVRLDTGTWWIDPADRVSYEEAGHITGRSRGYLRRHIASGEIALMKPGDGVGRRAWLSRYHCEDVAASDEQVTERTSYWITMAHAAAQLGMARSNAYRSHHRNRLPATRTATGHYLVRQRDVDSLLILESP